MMAEWQLATSKTRFSRRGGKIGNFRHSGANHDRRDLMVDRLHLVS